MLTMSIDFPPGRGRCFCGVSVADVACCAASTNFTDGSMSHDFVEAHIHQVLLWLVLRKHWRARELMMRGRSLVELSSIEAESTVATAHTPGHLTGPSRCGQCAVVCVCVARPGARSPAMDGRRVPLQGR